MTLKDSAFFAHCQKFDWWRFKDVKLKPMPYTSQTFNYFSESVSLRHTGGMKPGRCAVIGIFVMIGLHRFTSKHVPKRPRAGALQLWAGNVSD
jgi:hypothetical protein